MMFTRRRKGEVSVKLERLKKTQHLIRTSMAEEIEMLSRGEERNSRICTKWPRWGGGIIV